MRVPSLPSLGVQQRVGRRMNRFRKYVRNSAVYQWRLFIYAGLAGTLGITLAVAGIVLLAMMAVGGSVLGVVGAAAMLGAGIVLTVSVYLWLTM